MNKLNKTNKEIIDEITKIVEPRWKFELDDFYGDRGGIVYPKIEELDILYYKFQGNKYHLPTKSEENELVGKINDLNIGSVSIVKIQSFGKYILIELNKNHIQLIKKYNNYLDFKNTNAEKINWIYEYLEEKIPEEFIGWNLFEKSK